MAVIPCFFHFSFSYCYTESAIFTEKSALNNICFCRSNGKHSQKFLQFRIVWGGLKISKEINLQNLKGTLKVNSQHHSQTIINFWISWNRDFPNYCKQQFVSYLKPSPVNDIFGSMSCEFFSINFEIFYNYYFVKIWFIIEKPANQNDIISFFAGTSLHAMNTVSVIFRFEKYLK